MLLIVFTVVAVAAAFAGARMSDGARHQLGRRRCTRPRSFPCAWRCCCSSRSCSSRASSGSISSSARSRPGSSSASRRSARRRSAQGQARGDGLRVPDPDVLHRQRDELQPRGAVRRDREAWSAAALPRAVPARAGACRRCCSTSACAQTAPAVRAGAVQRDRAPARRGHHRDRRQDGPHATRRLPPPLWAPACSPCSCSPCWGCGWRGAVRRRGRRGSSRRCRPGRSSPWGSWPGTAGGSPRRSRRGRPRAISVVISP